MMIGGLNVVQALVDAERRILILESIVELIINSRTGPRYNINLEQLRDQAMHDLKTKYPDLGITVKDSG